MFSWYVLDSLEYGPMLGYVFFLYNAYAIQVIKVI